MKQWFKYNSDSAVQELLLCISALKIHYPFLLKCCCFISRKILKCTTNVFFLKYTCSKTIAINGNTQSVQLHDYCWTSS